MDLVRIFEQQQIGQVERPKLRSGDIVRVETKVTEGDKTRLQVFEGTILGIRGSGPSATFTVRRETGGFGVERIFPLYSPLITRIQIVKRQKIRRAKLTYLRLAGRRRFQEDIKAMQRHEKQEARKKQLAEDARKRAEEEKVQAEAQEKAEAEPEKIEASERDSKAGSGEVNE